MRAERAGGAVELAEELLGLDAAQLSAEAVREHGEFLAHGRRRRRLAVRVREQRHVPHVAGHRRDLLDERRRLRQPHLLRRTLHHEGVAEVVDVLARAAEVDEFRELLGVVVASVGHDLREAALEVVLDCLDVVHRLAFDLG